MLQLEPLEARLVPSVVPVPPLPGPVGALLPPVHVSPPAVTPSGALLPSSSGTTAHAPVNLITLETPTAAQHSPTALAIQSSAVPQTTTLLGDPLGTVNSLITTVTNILPEVTGLLTTNLPSPMTSVTATSAESLVLTASVTAPAALGNVLSTLTNLLPEATTLLTTNLPSTTTGVTAMSVESVILASRQTASPAATAPASQLTNLSPPFEGSSAATVPRVANDYGGVSAGIFSADETPPQVPVINARGSGGGGLEWNPLLQLPDLPLPVFPMAMEEVPLL